MFHWDVRDVSTPHLVHPLGARMIPQIGVDLVAKGGFTRVWSGCNCLKSHLLHETGNSLAVQFMAMSSQSVRHSWITKLRVPEILLIDQSHQMQVLRGFRNRLVVEARSGNACQSALPPGRVVSMTLNPARAC
jgi:hypothetical protein